MVGGGGAWVAQSIKCLPLVQVVILGSWDQAPCSAGSLPLPLPLLHPRPCSLSLLLTLSLKEVKKQQ